VTGIRYWVANLILTAILGWLFWALRVPSGWLIAALISAGTVATLTGRQLTPPPAVLRPAQGCFGVLAVAPLAGVATSTMIHYLGLSVLCSGATLIICLLCALVLVRVAKTLSPATAVLSTLAGGAVGISTMAPELRVDHRYVAMSQYLRLIVVTLTLPFVLGLAGSGLPGTHVGQSRGSTLIWVAAAAVIVVAGYAALRMKWPAPFLLGPMLVGLVFAVATEGHLVLSLPPVVNVAAYVIIGWQAGGSFTRSSMRQFVRLLPWTLTFIAATMAGCLGLALGVSAWTGLPFSHAYLATSPGGIYAVLAAAADSEAGPIVVIMQVFRMLVMVLCAVVGSKLLNKRYDRTGPTDPPSGPERMDSDYGRCPGDEITNPAAEGFTSSLASSTSSSEQPPSTLMVARSSPRLLPRLMIAIGMRRAAAYRTNR
jgi:membrane AbrB-like protein